MTGLRTILLGATMLAATAQLTGLTMAAPADAQSRSAARAPAPIAFGATVNGRITAAEQNCSVETPGARAYSFTAEAGTRIEVTMQADDFDTLVEVGQIVDCAFVSMGSNDDGAGPEDGLNSRLTGTLPTAGTYIIRATSFGGNGNGPFQLTLNRLPPLRGAPDPIAVTVGQPAMGALTADDALIPNEFNEFSGLGEFGESSLGSIIDTGRPYHLYSLSGAAGDEYVITLASEEFDAFLEVGVDSPLGYSVAQSNDDGGEEGDGLNSRLKINFRNAGTLIIRVSPLSMGTGAYTLSVEPAPKTES